MIPFDTFKTASMHESRARVHAETGRKNAHETEPLAPDGEP
jgi:hypothetical protein